MNEKDLITKYVPSYANTSNPSSWASVSNFDAYEILHNPDNVYGLTDQQRLEVSQLILLMQKLILATKSTLDITQGITIHTLYDETRRAIASADKNK